jgi:GNAT superfamily N-acetyltransferase
VEGTLGRVQRVLWAIGPDRAGAGNYADDLVALLDEYEPMHALIARLSGKVCGLAHYLYHRSTIQLAPSCYLQDLFTSEAARGLGVGRALIHAVYEQAKAAGSPRVYWQTHESNVAAMKLYDKVAEKSGFLVYRHTL